MSLHEDIVVEMHRILEQTDADIITPGSLALAVQRRYISNKVDAHIEYASLEHCKAIARRVLAGKHDIESDESEAYQGELFTGRLQTRYPLPRPKGEEPAYKLRENMSDDEIRWNIRSLRKSADARLEHADALEAWFRSRSAA